VSYYHWLRLQRFDHPAVRLAKASSFEAFLTAPQTRTSLRAHPVDSYLTDVTGRLHAGAYVRLEHLNEDLAPVTERLGFPMTLTRANASERPSDWAGLYSEETAALVAELCAPDIARFGSRPCRRGRMMARKTPNRPGRAPTSRCPLHPRLPITRRRSRASMITSAARTICQSRRRTARPISPICPTFRICRTCPTCRNFPTCPAIPGTISANCPTCRSFPNCRSPRRPEDPHMGRRGPRRRFRAQERAAAASSAGRVVERSYPAERAVARMSSTGMSPA